MRISGATILARKAMVTKKFGADAWRALFRDMQLRHACFQAPVTGATLLPLEGFLGFHDELVRRFFSDDRSAYFLLGEEAAAWGLAGPYRDVAEQPAQEGVAGLCRRLWSTYFVETESRCEVEARGGLLDLRAWSLPDWHPYFEYLVAGYCRGALELTCANPVVMQRLPTSGRFQYHYRFDVAASDFASSDRDDEASFVGQVPVAGTCRRGPVPSGRSRLSKRELEVIRLVALGKTNKEIASLLAISARTVQTHIANVYDKLGIYSRAAAASWLQENDAREAVAPPAELSPQFSRTPATPLVDSRLRSHSLWQA